MFISNKYTFWYAAIIGRAKARILDGYVENHHILPKSLFPQFRNIRIHTWNKVQLTAREHFLCHKLLTKMVSGRNRAKMISALWMMANCGNKNQLRNYKIPAKEYERIRIHIAELTSTRNQGKSQSVESNLKRSQTLKGRPSKTKGRQSPLKGRPSGKKGINQSSEHIRKRTEKLKNRKGHSPTSDVRQRISEKLKGKTFSAETIAKRIATKLKRKLNE